MRKPIYYKMSLIKKNSIVYTIIRLHLFCRLYISFIVRKTNNSEQVFVHIISNTLSTEIPIDFQLFQSIVSDIKTNICVTRKFRNKQLH